jgi:hypothetical protein
MKKPYRKWMYHKDSKPKMFTFKDQEEIEDMRKKGWCDSPAEIENVVKPEPEQEGDDYDTDELLEAFNADPQSLTKHEHLALGKSIGVTVKSSWKEETLISKIQEHLNGDDETAD